MIIHDGDTVALLYDGKFTRAVEGRVVKLGPDSIRVRFIPWANEEVGFVELKCKYDKYNDKFYGWLKGAGSLGVMRYFFGLAGDYYRVYPKQFILDEGYKVAPYERSA